MLGVPKPGCLKPGCLQFLRALLRSFELFCALLRSFALICAFLRSFALFCAHFRSFALICTLLRSFSCFCIRPRLRATAPRLGTAENQHFDSQSLRYQIASTNGSSKMPFAPWRMDQKWWNFKQEKFKSQFFVFSPVSAHWANWNRCDFGTWSQNCNLTKSLIEISRCGWEYLGVGGTVGECRSVNIYLCARVFSDNRAIAKSREFRANYALHLCNASITTSKASRPGSSYPRRVFGMSLP